jgi:hypothetical protein
MNGGPADRIVLARSEEQFAPKTQHYPCPESDESRLHHNILFF